MSKDGTFSPLKNIGRYGSVSLFVNAVMLLHFGVYLSQCTGRQPIQNSCWNHHIHCRHMDTTLSPLLFGEIVWTLTGCYGVRCAWSFMGSFIVILLLSSHFCQLRPCWPCIQTRHRLLCGHAWTVLRHVCCASTSAACSWLSTVWYECTISPDSFDRICLITSICTILIPLPTWYQCNCIQTSSLIPQGVPYRLWAIICCRLVTLGGGWPLK